MFAFLRLGGGKPILIVSNLTPTIRHGYQVGVPRAGLWREIINTDANWYGGSNVGNAGAVQAVECMAHGQPYSLELILPPLATVMLRPEAE